MKKVSELITQKKFSADLRTHEELTDNNVFPIQVVSVVNYIFGIFRLNCPGFDKQFGVDLQKLNATKTQWMLAFQDQNIKTQRQVENGVRRSRIEKPVNIPMIGQFLEWCRPDLAALGFPQPDRALRDAFSLHANDYHSQEERPCNKIFYNVLRNVGVQRLQKANEQESLRLFTDEYYKVIDAWQNGAHILEIPRLLVDKSKDFKPNKALAHESISKILKDLRFKASNQATA